MLRIQGILWSEENERHIWDRHKLTTLETEEAAYNAKLILRGRGDGVYQVFGQSDAGRYLLVVVKLMDQGYAHVITARLMSDTERRRYKSMTEH